MGWPRLDGHRFASTKGKTTPMPPYEPFAPACCPRPCRPGLTRRQGEPGERRARPGRVGRSCCGHHQLRHRAAGTGATSSPNAHLPANADHVAPPASTAGRRGRARPDRAETPPRRPIHHHRRIHSGGADARPFPGMPDKRLLIACPTVEAPDGPMPLRDWLRHFAGADAWSQVVSRCGPA
jgi:hypothetical protein